MQWNGSAAQEVPVTRFSVDSFEVTGENPLTEQETSRVLQPFVGEHEGLDSLVDASTALENQILSAGHSFHRVILPPQTIDQGKVTLRVVVFKIAKVEVVGNEYFSPENIKASLPSLLPGEVPDTQVLSRELIVANNHPSKQVTIRIKQSEAPDSIDAELAVEDRRPWGFFTSLNNVGINETGEFRLSAGVQHTNLTSHDDALTLSYTTSPGHFSDVKQYGLNYELPVYALSGTLSFFYSSSDVDSGVIEQVFDVSGAGTFFGAFYTHRFMNIGSYRHSLRAGIEDRLFENNVSFQGTPLGVDVRSRPFTLSYVGEYRFESGTLEFDLSYSRNTGSGPANNDVVYASARQGASESWGVFRLSTQLMYMLPGRWLVMNRVKAQYTDDPLISGEQLGAGGVNSIRAFEERAVSGDTGVVTTFEIITPQFRENLNLFGFLDAGHTNLIDALPGETGSETLISAGAGLRWSWRNNFNLDLSYGHELNGTDAVNAGGSRFHLSMFYRY